MPDTRSCGLHQTSPSIGTRPTRPRLSSRGQSSTFTRNGVGPGRYSIEKLFETVTGSPENGGTFAARNKRATQPPTSVPANAPPTLVMVARPLGAKVTETLPEPVGPSGFLQLPALAAAAPNAETAAPLSKAAPSAAGAGGAATAGAGASGFLVSAGFSAGFSAGLLAGPAAVGVSVAAAVAEGFVPAAVMAWATLSAGEGVGASAAPDAGASAVAAVGSGAAATGAAAALVSGADDVGALSSADFLCITKKATPAAAA